MRKQFHKYFPWLIVLALSSCDEGSPLPKTPPDTSIFINKIDLVGQDRLTSVVSLNWLGTDKDGFVKEYEISFDEIIWSRTTSTDSTFNFTISEGSDTANIDFFVRAIDNDGLIDPSPAYLQIPIRNTAPEIQFDEDFFPVDTSNTVFSLIWNTLDLDGEETIDSTFIKINEGPWFPIDGQKNAARFIPVDPTATGEVETRILLSSTISPSFVINSESELNTTISGLKLNDINTVYIQTRDNAGSLSDVDTTSTFYLKSKTSDLLIIAAHFDKSLRSTYNSIINASGNPADFIDILDNEAGSNIRFWNFNFPLLIDLYPSLFWYSSDENFSSGSPLLEVAISGLQPYLDDGGKLIISAFLTGDADQSSPIFNFAPIDSISPKNGVSQARYVNGSVARPQLPAYDSLICTANIANAAPFHNSLGSTALFLSEPLKLNGWDGPEVIGAKVENGSGQTNFIFFSIELHKFNGNPQGLQTFFETALNEEFDW
ncbi:hypothetical protein HZR84_08005 [Hyphobacterium sp. CCMP332]|nr:hypothetical protein HZR84_08005 [Hyphobacterium sp. CCMP332]